MKSHFDRDGAAWTKKHHVVCVSDVFFKCDDEDEDKYTKKMMRLHGVNNVRGGAYCNVVLGEDEKRFLEREIIGSSDKCFRCKKYGHFAKDCQCAKSNIVKMFAEHYNVKSW